jgi:hypothetical protein
MAPGDAEAAFWPEQPAVRRHAAEQFEAMAVDAVARAGLDVVDYRRQPGVGDVRRPAASAAHHVVVMARLAPDVGVVAVGQVEPFHDAQRQEQVEGSEDSCPANAQPALANVGHEVGGGEVAIPGGNQLGHGSAWAGQSIAGAVEGGEEGGRGCHLKMIPDLTILCRDSVSRRAGGRYSRAAGPSLPCRATPE